jgi:hypothetical protein
MTQQWIATRTLTDSGGNEIEVRIGTPEIAPKGEWQCPIQIGTDPVAYGRGVDGFQALVMGLELIRVTLAKHGTFTWVGGEPGDPGFPRTLPSYFGFAFYQKLDQMIDAEVATFAAEAQKRRQGKP